MYQWAPVRAVSRSAVAGFHLATCVCTSSSDKELIRADKACVLTHMGSINSFHNRHIIKLYLRKKFTQKVDQQGWGGGGGVGYWTKFWRGGVPLVNPKTHPCLRETRTRQDQTSPMSKEIIPLETHLYGPPTQYLISLMPSQPLQ